MTEYMIVYRSLSGADEALKRTTLWQPVLEMLKMAAQNWIKADVPLGNRDVCQKGGISMGRKKRNAGLNGEPDKKHRA